MTRFQIGYLPSGHNFASRVCASLLTAIGASDLVTHSVKQYEASAVWLTRRRHVLYQLQLRLVRHSLVNKSQHNTTQYVTQHDTTTTQHQNQRDQVGRRGGRMNNKTETNSNTYSNKLVVNLKWIWNTFEMNLKWTWNTFVSEYQFSFNLQQLHSLPALSTVWHQSYRTEPREGIPVLCPCWWWLITS